MLTAQLPIKITVPIVIRLWDTTTMLLHGSAVPSVGMGLSWVEFRAAMTTILIAWMAAHLLALFNQGLSAVEDHPNARSTRMPP